MVYEILILETIYYYCVKNGYIINNNCSLAFDGILIEKNKYKTELLQELQNEVIYKTGLSIEFKQKEMNEGFIFSDEELKELTKDDENDKNGVFNDLEGARKVYQLYPHFMCCKLYFCH